MTAPERIKQLVETFEKNINDYRFNKNETELRRQFLDPFFEALGWDVDNKQGQDERHKEVAHEFSVEIDGQQKKADYAFRVEKDNFDFLVEAKKPSVKVESNLDAAFQIRSYGWSAKIPLNILTDFEHLAIYDCRTRPNYAKDNAKTGRIELIHYQDYVERWDEIANLFSPTAIRNGALNEYTDGLKSKKGTQQVDDAFLEEIEGWREALAKNIATRNKDKNLDEEQINFVVQMTIDRIIFLRICEDRGIERNDQLKETGAGLGVYEALCRLFQKADARYNSGLFHFKKEKDRENPDTLSATLEIDDKVLKDIIKDLYYPSPYAFTYIPTEILGSVYERFLGKVIRLTAGGNAKVEEKPEVRKAGGVYYTPSYIVEYIVKNTVGKLIEGNRDLGIGGKTPDDVAKIKIVDPACGSGSFLLGAYQYLLDWHLDYYASNAPEKWVKNKTLITADNKTYRLSIDEKKRILLNNIHGVDLDPQAVEVSKLSLLLKVVEEPGQLKMFEEGHILPNLNKNIKNGNALIGTDYLDGQTFKNMEEMKRVKPFDWENEFPEVFKRGSGKNKTSEVLKTSEVSDGGFDVVIGNPPYGTMIPKEQLEYFGEKYKYQDYQKDLYLLFLERYYMILGTNKLLGVIISNTWLQSVNLQNIRKYLSSSYLWQKILHLPEKVFKAVVDTHVVIFQKNEKGVQDNDDIVIDFMKNKEAKQSHLLNGKFISKNGEPINIVANPQKQILFRKITSESTQLSTLFVVYNGVKPFEVGKGKPPQTEKIAKEQPFVVEGKLPDKNWKPLLRGSLIHRYINYWNNDYWILYGEWLAAPRDPEIFNTPKKIMVRQTGDSIIATIVEGGFVARNNMHIILSEEENYQFEYLLGLMNSKLMDFAYSFINPEKGEALAEIKKKHVEQLPIRPINFNEPAEKSQHDKMVSLVEKMLALHKSLQGDGHFGSDRHLRTPQEQELIQRQITATDKAIDSLVYELYGLSEEEIGIVEQ